MTLNIWIRADASYTFKTALVWIHLALRVECQEKDFICQIEKLIQDHEKPLTGNAKQDLPPSCGSKKP